MTTEAEFPEIYRHDYVFQAKMAEQAGSYDQMAAVMRQIACMQGQLTLEERNLLSVAYQNMVDARRGSWRTIYTLEQKEESQGHDDQVQMIRQYRIEVEEELRQICSDILDVLSQHLISDLCTWDYKVFYYKMKGDYCRYLAEFETGDDRKDAANAALSAYKSAMEIAIRELAPSDPVRLGLALNFSVFYYEIWNSLGKAYRLAQSAYEEARAQLHTLPEEGQKHAKMIMQLLLDNYTLWTSDGQIERDAAGTSDSKETKEKDVKNVNDTPAS